MIPTVALARSTAKIDAYAEAGVGGVSYPTQRLSTNTASAAVELAKAFGGSDGHKYVNAVLDRAARVLRAAEF